jgi:hypothetical protein
MKRQKGILHISVPRQMSVVRFSAALKLQAPAVAGNIFCKWAVQWAKFPLLFQGSIKARESLTTGSIIVPGKHMNSKC